MANNTGTFFNVNDNDGIPLVGVSTDGKVMINHLYGNCLIGSTSVTGTASQPLQVTGGAYVSGNLGIGTINPTATLEVVGSLKVSGTITGTATTATTAFGFSTTASINTSGIITATGGFVGGLTGTASTANNVSSTININTSGIITATGGFVGGLTGTASTATAAGTAYGLTGSPNITVGNVTGSAATFTNNLNVGTAITMYSSTGIISATKYYGDGSSLSGIDATRIVSGLSSVTVATSSTISAYVNGSNIFNVTGTGVTMTSGKRLDVSSYTENVNFLGSVSGSTVLDVGTYSVFVADISGTTSVTFTLSGAVSGRLSSATLILRFSGSGSRSVNLAFNPKYVGGAGPIYSTTAVTDIISFFTADAGTTTFISVVGQAFS
ncbi:MAG: hypothetical protein EBU90_23965 [Proteobacteria bacterium]|nr:hypothetical protein [Pseudomonadota bacterium]